MRPSRMTTRRWMIAVAAVALTTTGCFQAWNWNRYYTALLEYESSRAYFGEGRVTLGQCLEKSVRLMETRLALCSTTRAQVTAIRAHVDRTSRLIRDDEAWFWDIHGGFIDLFETKQNVEECRERVKRLTGGQ